MSAPPLTTAVPAVSAPPGVTPTEKVPSAPDVAVAEPCLVSTPTRAVQLTRTGVPGAAGPVVPVAGSKVVTAPVSTADWWSKSVWSRS